MRRSTLAALAVPTALAVVAGALAAASAPSPAGEEIMRRVNARSRGEGSRMRLEMTLHDAKRGDFHKSIVVLRKQLPSGYRTAYWITAPEHEKGIGLLLSEDPAQNGTWMYFPASSQVVHVAIRGLSALASDFSCEDLRVAAPLADYGFRALGPASLDGVSTLQVEMVPRTERLRSELGFAKSVGWVRDDIWLIVRADYYDENGKVFKTFRAGDIQQVQGVWTARRFTMENLRAQHSTEVRLAEVDYGARLSEDLFAPDRLARPVP